MVGASDINSAGTASRAQTAISVDFRGDYALGAGGLRASGLSYGGVHPNVFMTSSTAGR